MKVYTLREETPLKFHKFIWYVWMPLSLVVAIYTAWESISEFIGYILLAPEITIVLLCIFSCLVKVAFVLAPALIFIGFFKWRAYSWYILMFLSISNVVCSPLLLLFTKEYEGLASMLGKISGILIDIFIILYYWKRRKLFNINLFVKRSVAGETTQKRNNDYMFCHHCGNKLPQNSVFCNKCGTRVFSGGKL